MKDINTIIAEVLEEFQKSEVSKRINALESFGYTHGFPEFTGQNIPDFIAEKLRSTVSKSFEAVRGDNPHVNPLIMQTREEIYQSALSSQRERERNFLK